MQRNRRAPFLKIAALLTTSIFTANNLLWADSIGSLAPILRSLSPYPIEQFNKRTVDVAKSLQAWVPPQHLGAVKSGFVGARKGTIIHIQDAHAQQEAQINIARMIDHMAGRGQIHWVALEGAEGELRPELFSFFPQPDVRRDVSQYFLKEGRLTGAEYAAIVKRPELKLFGAEKRKLYEKNRAIYLKHLQSKQKVGKTIEELYQLSHLLLPAIFSESLRQLHGQRAGFLKDPKKLSAYALYLEELAQKQEIAIQKFPAFQSLVSLIHMESKINFDLVQEELPVFAEYLGNHLDSAGKTEFLLQTKRLKEGGIGIADYYQRLTHLARAFAAKHPKTDSLSQFASSIDFLNYISLYRKLDGVFFDDMESLENEIKEKLYASQKEREFDAWLRVLETSRKMSNLSLTTHDVDMFYSHRNLFSAEYAERYLAPMLVKYRINLKLPADLNSLDHLFSRVEAFYHLAIRRDQVLVSNTLKLMRAEKQKAVVLVTGGFHSPGIERILKHWGYSYIVITPQVRRMEEEEFVNQKYENALLGKPLPLDDYFMRFLSKSAAVKSLNPRFQLMAPLMTPERHEGASVLNDLQGGLQASFFSLLFNLSILKRRNLTAAVNEVLTAVPKDLNLLEDHIRQLGRAAYRERWRNRYPKKGSPDAQLIYRLEDPENQTYSILERYPKAGRPFFNAGRHRMSGGNLKPVSIGAHHILALSHVPSYLIEDDVLEELIKAESGGTGATDPYIVLPEDPESLGASAIDSARSEVRNVFKDPNSLYRFQFQSGTLGDEKLFLRALQSIGDKKLNIAKVLRDAQVTTERPIVIQVGWDSNAAEKTRIFKLMGETPEGIKTFKLKISNKGSGFDRYQEIGNVLEAGLRQLGYKTMLADPTMDTARVGGNEKIISIRVKAKDLENKETELWIEVETNAKKHETESFNGQMTNVLWGDKKNRKIYQVRVLNAAEGISQKMERLGRETAQIRLKTKPEAQQRLTQQDRDRAMATQLEAQKLLYSQANGKGQKVIGRAEVRAGEPNPFLAGLEKMKDDIQAELRQNYQQILMDSEIININFEFQQIEDAAAFIIDQLQKKIRSKQLFDFQEGSAFYQEVIDPFYENSKQRLEELQARVDSLESREDVENKSYEEIDTEFKLLGTKHSQILSQISDLHKMAMQKPPKRESVPAAPVKEPMAAPLLQKSVPPPVTKAQMEKPAGPKPAPAVPGVPKPSTASPAADEKTEKKISAEDSSNEVLLQKFRNGTETIISQVDEEGVFNATLAMKKLLILEKSVDPKKRDGRSLPNLLRTLLDIYYNAFKDDLKDEDDGDTKLLRIYWKLLGIQQQAIEEKMPSAGIPLVQNYLEEIEDQLQRVQSQIRQSSSDSNLLKFPPPKSAVKQEEPQQEDKPKGSDSSSSSRWGLRSIIFLAGFGAYLFGWPPSLSDTMNVKNRHAPPAIVIKDFKTEEPVIRSQEHKLKTAEMKPVEKKSSAPAPNPLDALKARALGLEAERLTLEEELLDHYDEEWKLKERKSQSAEAKAQITQLAQLEEGTRARLSELAPNLPYHTSLKGYGAILLKEKNVSTQWYYALWDSYLPDIYFPDPKSSPRFVKPPEILKKYLNEKSGRDYEIKLGLESFPVLRLAVPLHSRVFHKETESLETNKRQKNIKLVEIQNELELISKQIKVIQAGQVSLKIADGSQNNSIAQKPPLHGTTPLFYSPQQDRMMVLRAPANGQIKLSQNVMEARGKGRPYLVKAGEEIASFTDPDLKSRLDNFKNEKDANIAATGLSTAFLTYDLEDSERDFLEWILRTPANYYQIREHRTYNEMQTDRFKKILEAAYNELNYQANFFGTLLPAEVEALHRWEATRTIRSPVDGEIYPENSTHGANVAQGAPIVSIIPKGQPFVRIRIPHSRFSPNMLFSFRDKQKVERRAKILDMTVQEDAWDYLVTAQLDFGSHAADLPREINYSILPLDPESIRPVLSRHERKYPAAPVYQAIARLGNRRAQPVFTIPHGGMMGLNLQEGDWVNEGQQLGEIEGWKAYSETVRQIVQFNNRAIAILEVIAATGAVSSKNVGDLTLKLGRLQVEIKRLRDIASTMEVRAPFSGYLRGTHARRLQSTTTGFDELKILPLWLDGQADISKQVSLAPKDAVIVQIFTGEEFLAEVLSIETGISNAEGRDRSDYQRVHFRILHAPLALFPEQGRVNLIIPSDQEQTALKPMLLRLRREIAVKNFPLFYGRHLPSYPVKFVPSEQPVPELVRMSLAKFSGITERPQFADRIVELIGRERDSHRRVEAFEYLPKIIPSHELSSYLVRFTEEGSEDLSQAALRRLSERGDIMDIIRIFDNAYGQRDANPRQKRLAENSLFYLKQMLENARYVNLIEQESRLDTRVRNMTQKLFLSIVHHGKTSDAAVIQILRSNFWDNEELRDLLQGQGLDDILSRRLLNEWTRRTAEKTSEKLAHGRTHQFAHSGQFIDKDHWARAVIMTMEAESDRRMLKHSPAWSSWNLYVNPETGKITENINLRSPSDPAQATLYNLSQADDQGNDPLLDLWEPSRQFDRISEMMSHGRYREVLRILKMPKYQHLHDQILGTLLTQENPEIRLHLAEYYVDLGDTGKLSQIEGSGFFVLLLQDLRTPDIFKHIRQPEVSVRAIYETALIKLLGRFDQLPAGISLDRNVRLDKNRLLLLYFSLIISDYEISSLARGNEKDTRFNYLASNLATQDLETTQKAAREIELVIRSYLTVIALVRETYRLDNGVFNVPIEVERFLQQLEQQLNRLTFRQDTFDEWLRQALAASSIPEEVKKLFQDTQARRMNSLLEGHHESLSLKEIIYGIFHHFRWVFYFFGGLLGIGILLFFYERLIKPFYAYYVQSGPKKLPDMVREAQEAQRRLDRRLEERKAENRTATRRSEVRFFEETLSHWNNILAIENRPLTRTDYLRLVTYAKRAAFDNTVVYHPEKLRQVFSNWDIEKEMINLDQLSDMVIRSLERLRYEIDALWQKERSTEIEFVLKEMLHQYRELISIGKYAEDLRNAFSVITALKEFEVYQISQIAGVTNTWHAVLWGLDWVKRILYFVPRVLLLYIPLGSLAKGRRFLGITFFKGWFVSRLERSVNGANAILPGFYPQNTIRLSQEIIWEAFVRRYEPGKNTRPRREKESRQFWSRIFIVLTLGSLGLGGYLYFFAGNLLVNYWTLFSIGGVIAVIGYSFHLKQVLTGWHAPDYFSNKAVFRRHLKDWSRNVRAVSKKEKRLFPSPILNEHEWTLYARQSELDPGKERSVDILIISYGSEGKDTVWEARIKEYLKPHLRLGNAYHEKGEVNLLMIPTGKVSGSGAAYLVAREKLKEEYARLRRTDRRLPESMDEARIVHLLVGGGKNSDPLSFIQRYDGRFLPFNIDGKPASTLLYQWLNGIKAARELVKSSRGGSILLPSDVLYIGPLLKQGDITLISSLVSIGDAFDQKLGLVFYANGKQVEQLLEKPDEQRLEKSMRKSYFDYDNRTVRQLNGFTGIIIFSFDENPSREVYDRLMDSLYYGEMIEHSHKDRMRFPGITDDAILDPHTVIDFIMGVLIPLANPELDMRSYLEKPEIKKLINRPTYHFYDDYLFEFWSHKAQQRRQLSVTGFQAPRSIFADLRDLRVFRDRISQGKLLPKGLIQNSFWKGQEGFPLRIDQQTGNILYGDISGVNGTMKDMLIAQVPVRNNGSILQALLIMNLGDNPFRENTLLGIPGEKLVPRFVNKKGEKLFPNVTDLRKIPIFPTSKNKALDAHKLSWVSKIASSGPIVLDVENSDQLWKENWTSIHLIQNRISDSGVTASAEPDAAHRSEIRSQAAQWMSQRAGRLQIPTQNNYLQFEVKTKMDFEKFLRLLHWEWGKKDEDFLSFLESALREIERKLTPEVAQMLTINRQSFSERRRKWKLKLYENSSYFDTAYELIQAIGLYALDRRLPMLEEAESKLLEASSKARKTESEARSANEELQKIRKEIMDEFKQIEKILTLFNHDFPEVPALSVSELLLHSMAADYDARYKAILSKFTAFSRLMNFAPGKHTRGVGFNILTTGIHLTDDFVQYDDVDIRSVLPNIRFVIEAIRSDKGLEDLPYAKRERIKKGYKIALFKFWLATGPVIIGDPDWQHIHQKNRLRDRKLFNRISKLSETKELREIVAENAEDLARWMDEIYEENPEVATFLALLQWYFYLDFFWNYFPAWWKGPSNKIVLEKVLLALDLPENQLLIQDFPLLFGRRNKYSHSTWGELKLTREYPAFQEHLAGQVKQLTAGFKNLQDASGLKRSEMRKQILQGLREIQKMNASLSFKHLLPLPEKAHALDERLIRDLQDTAEELADIKFDSKRNNPVRNRGYYVLEYHPERHSLEFVKALSRHLPQGVKLIIIGSDENGTGTRGELYARLRSRLAREVENREILLPKFDMWNWSLDGFIKARLTELGMKREDVLRIKENKMTHDRLSRQYGEYAYYGTTILASRFLVIAGGHADFAGAREMELGELLAARERLERSA